MNTMTDVVEYRYGMRLRGYSIGCQPMDGLLYRDEDDSGEYYDILVYDRPLTEDEMKHFSLDYITEGEEEMAQTTVIDAEYIDNLLKEDKEMENTNVVAFANTNEEENDAMQNVEEVVDDVNVTEEVENDEEEILEGAEEDAFGIDFNGLKFDLIALDKSNQPYSCAQIAKNIENGKFTFENTVQRTNVWNIEQKSLLIHSLITKMPIPVMYAKSCEGGVKDFLDGKQRANAIYEFANDKFTLTSCPPIHITLSEDEAKEKGFDEDNYERDSKNRIVIPVDINGYTFSELPSGLQDAFKNAMITIFTYANDDGSELTDEQTADVFFRLNNGTPLTKVEITRVKARCYNLIKQVASHELFTEAMTSASLAKYANEDVVMKGLMLLLNPEEPCLENKAIRPFIEELDIEPDEIARLSDVFEMILDAHTTMKLRANAATDVKERKFLLNVTKRIYTRMHLVSIIPIVDRAVFEEKTSTDMANFFYYFFGDKKCTTISKEYNSAKVDGVNKTPKVLKRLHALTTEYEKFFSENAPTEEVE